MPDFPSYPLTPFLPEISRLLAKEGRLVLTAETGAGKSTLVPPYIVREPWLEGKKILMLEPRRIAAAAVASRASELLDSPLGGLAGYRVRGERRTGRETRIEVLTEGLLTRLIQADPLLDGVGLLIFDEFHERSIHADLALALALEVKRARPDLALLVMSATLDAARLSRFLEDSPILDCPGRLFPVESSYRSLPDRGWEAPFADGIRDLLQDLRDQADEGRADVLAFLPGLAEIRRVEAALLERPVPGTEVLVLHGSLPLEEQRKVLVPRKGGEGRRIILATSVAETSLTVPGIGAVADAGWARTTRFHPATGLDRLVTERVSRAQADQRKGRAGRLGPGRCLRFWSETEVLAAETEPEILRSDLAALVLEAAAWGAKEPEDLRWLDPPPRGAWEKARTLLTELAALTPLGGATAAGKEILGLGLAPRLGMLVRKGQEAGKAGLAASSAAILEERETPAFRGEPDFRLRLEALRTGTGPAAWIKAVEREARRILRLLGVAGDGFSWRVADEDAVGPILAAGFPDRIALRREDGSFDFVQGRKAWLPKGVTGELADSEWILALAADAGEKVGDDQARPASRGKRSLRRDRVLRRGGAGGRMEGPRAPGLPRPPGRKARPRPEKKPHFRGNRRGLRRTARGRGPGRTPLDRPEPAFSREAPGLLADRRGRGTFPTRG